MKKTYINPKLEIVKIASKAQMLAGSVAQSVSDETPGEWGSREFVDMDDMDEDDFDMDDEEI